jgi:hypothetical protein
MALTALLNLVDTLNPATAQTQGAATLQAAPAAQPLAQTAPNLANANSAEPQDLFVSSNQDPVAQATADAAGLFTVAQPAAFTPAAGALLAQPNTLGGANPTPAVAATDAPQAPAPATGAGNATGAVAAEANAAGNNVATAAGANATAANTAETTPADANPAANNAATGGAVGTNATAPNATGTAGTGAAAGTNTATPIANATTANATASTSAGTATVQDQLQALNSALEALGLSAADISQIDRIATQSNDFSPTAYSSLAYQLIAQAQNAAPPTTLTAANAATGGAPAGAAPGATTVKTAAG